MTSIDTLLQHLSCETTREQVILLAVVRGLTTNNEHTQLADKFINYATLKDERKPQGITYLGYLQVSPISERDSEMFINLRIQECFYMFQLRVHESTFDFETAAEVAEQNGDAERASAYKKFAVLIGETEKARQDFENYKSPAQVFLEKQYASEAEKNDLRILEEFRAALSESSEAD